LKLVTNEALAFDVNLAP